MRVLAVVNPAAGGQADEFVGPLEAMAELELEVATTAGPGDGTWCAADGVTTFSPDVVVSVGGDGTAGEVARGLAVAGPSSPPLLVAPGGTGNSNFRGLWNDLPWPEVVEKVFAEKAFTVRRMDLMRLVELNEQTLLGVSAGMIPECLVVARTLPLSGRERLATAAVQVLDTYQPYPGRVIVDDVVLAECETFLVVVGGVRHRGGLLKMLPDSLVDDGLLDVCVVSAQVPTDEFGLAALSGSLRELDGVFYGRGERVRLERLDGQPMKLEHDGELETGPNGSYQIEIVPGPIGVVVPDPVPSCFTGGVSDA